MKRGSLLTSIACLALAPSAAWTQTNLLDGIGTAPGVAQRIEWLHRNALVVRSINPDDLDFSDLEPVKARIGDARLVLLGARTAASSEARARFVEFLHERMGFDVVAFDAAFFDGERLDERLGGAASVDGKFLKDVFSGRNEPAVVADYAQKTRRSARPLRVTGYGFAASPVMERDLAAALFEFLGRAAPQLAESAGRKSIQSLVAKAAPGNSSSAPRVSGAQWAALQNLIAALTPEAFPPAEARRASLFRRSLQNLAMALQWRDRTIRALRGERGSVSMNFAQEKLAENLAWLAKTWYPDRKIMVWAGANAMLLRGLAGVTPHRPGAGNMPTMGDLITREFAGQTYSLAFTSPNDPALPFVPEGTDEPFLEDLLARVGKPYLFLDLHSAAPEHWLRQSLPARVLGGPAIADWSAAFDGIFYVDPLR